MKDILNMKQPKFYALINSRWRTVNALQVRALMLRVAQNTLNGVESNVKVKDVNGSIAEIRPDGILNRDLKDFQLDADYTLKLVKLQQELHK